MSFIGFCLQHLAAGAYWMASWFERAGILLTGTLPALLPPATLMRLVRRHYDRSYDEAATRLTGAVPGGSLEQWEQEALTRYRILSGTMLVLGTGTGRDSIALARRGFRVIGLDSSRSALRIAAQSARTAGVSIRFLQADFLSLPSRPASFDCILLPSIMYSAIPGRTFRQHWLRELTSRLSPGGFAILQFLVDSDPSARRRRIVEAINRWLIKLPDANRLYQPGDTCPHGHFLHAFQHEQELREELAESGVTVTELDWRKGYVVVGAQPQTDRN